MTMQSHTETIERTMRWPGGVNRGRANWARSGPERAGREVGVCFICGSFR